MEAGPVLRVVEVNFSETDETIPTGSLLIYHLSYKASQVTGTHILSSTNFKIKSVASLHKKASSGIIQVRQQKSS
jgi:hypothetical protein